MEQIAYVTWYVVFTDEEVSPHLIHRVLQKPFYHCYCFRQIGDHVYVVNPTISNVDSQIYEFTHASQLAQEISRNPDTKILKFKYKFDNSNRVFNITNMWPTCVSVVKMFLGIRSRAVTPYQLYKYLLKRGAFHFTNIE